MGDRRGGVQPVALPPAADGTPGPHDAVALTAGAALVGWCGMRGTVTLAAALALPTDFPFRDLILFTAFGVVLGTLVVQGLTLGRCYALRLEDDGSVDREVRLARVETLRAALAAAACCQGAETAELVRHRYELQLRRAEQDFAASGDGSGFRRRPATPRRRTPRRRRGGGACRDRGPAPAPGGAPS